jgi:hypothetical protein
LTDQTGSDSATHFLRIEGAATSAVPMVLRFFDLLLDTVIIAMMSIYIATSTEMAV